MSLNDHRETAFAWRQFRNNTETEVAAARTRELLGGLRYVAVLVSAGVVLVAALWLMRMM